MTYFNTNTAQPTTVGRKDDKVCRGKETVTICNGRGDS